MMVRYLNIIIKTNEPFGYESINKHQYTLKKKENALIRCHATNDLFSELSDNVLEYIFDYTSYFIINITSNFNLSNTTAFI
jgi:hypothetical protein